MLYLHSIHRFFFSLISALLLSSSSLYAQFVWQSGQSMQVCIVGTQSPVVQTALEILGKDAQKVLNSELLIGQDKKAPIFLSIKADGRWEGFTMQVSEQGQLKIIGSDEHGLAYGILEVSRLMGVSPWEWWADVTPKHRIKFELPSGFIKEEQPDVAFRGIFINDEDWGLQPWSSKNFEPNDEHIIGPKTNSKIFELLLRLRANTFWPAMHECTRPFFMTPGNREAAAKYGIYIGGSHCEPMACNPIGEWPHRGKGTYDYVHNASEVYRFWEERVQEVADQEILYTVGIRGLHDSGMLGAKTLAEQKQALIQIFNDQRKLLAQYVNKDITKVPQVFIPYKEILDVYNAGPDVPEDVCLMWCDDNYGYIRHFPTEAERTRKGGNGIYYHVSYWGRPHDYLWLGTFNPYLLYHQMKMGYDKGIQRIWILNVGDLKPAEYQTELFMDMAWDMATVERQGVTRHIEQFYAREFGSALGKGLQELMTEAYREAFACKPEFLGNTRTEEKDPKWKIVSDLPWSEAEISHRLAAYDNMSLMAEIYEKRISPELQDAYFQLVKYPIQAATQMNRKMLYGQLSRHGHNFWEASDAAYDSIQSLTKRYNEGYHNRGKWNYMMDYQPRKLSVFAPLSHDTQVETTPIASYSPLGILNVNSVSQGEYKKLEYLSPEGDAIGLIPGQEIEFQIPTEFLLTDSVCLEFHLLPTHPVKNKDLSFTVRLGNDKPLHVDYHTEGRSEEWKRNVLTNQAIRRIILPLNGGNLQKIIVISQDEGVVIQKINVTYKRCESPYILSGDVN